MKETIITERQRLVGAKAICAELAISWKETINDLNGNRENYLYEIDKRRHDKTIGKPKMLWETIIEMKQRSDTSCIIAKMALNTPGVWENSLPNLKKIAVSENGGMVLYEEILSEKDFIRTIDLLTMRATNKISILLKK